MATKRKSKIRLDTKVTKTPVIVIGEYEYEFYEYAGCIDDLFENGAMLTEVVEQGETWTEKAQILRLIADHIETLGDK